MKAKGSCIQRPWEVPHDKPSLSTQVSPSSLFSGSSLDSMLMINSADVRKVLSQLVEAKSRKKSIKASDLSKLTDWVAKNRPALSPYIHTASISDEGPEQMLTLHDSVLGIMPVLSHWRSPVSESVLCPCPLMLTLSQVIETQQVTRDQNRCIGVFSEGILLLVLHDKCEQPGDGVDARRISPQLVDLLKEIVKVAQAALKGEKGPATTAPWPIESPILGEDGEFFIVVFLPRLNHDGLPAFTCLKNRMARCRDSFSLIVHCLSSQVMFPESKRALRSWSDLGRISQVIPCFAGFRSAGTTT